MVIRWIYRFLENGWSCDSNMLFEQLAGGAGEQVAGIAFIGIDVYFQLEAGINTDQHTLKGRAAGSSHPHLHEIALLDLIKYSIIWVHVDVTQSPDHSLVHLKKAFWTHQHATRGPRDVT